jgi:hypothetical protein
MSAAVTSSRQHRFNLAVIPAVLAILFGQLTIERWQAARSGHLVAWTESFGVVVGGWHLVLMAGALTLLAIAGAISTWRSHAIAWLLVSVLWSAIAVVGAIHVFSQESIATLKVMYLCAFVVSGVILARALYRLSSEARSNTSPERTRER